MSPDATGGTTGRRGVFVWNRQERTRLGKAHW